MPTPKVYPKREDHLRPSIDYARRSKLSGTAGLQNPDNDAFEDGRAQPDVGHDDHSVYERRVGNSGQQFSEDEVIGNDGQQGGKRNAQPLPEVVFSSSRKRAHEIDVMSHSGSNTRHT